MGRAERRFQEKLNQRYVLACGVCGMEWANDDQTVGEMERQHYREHPSYLVDGVMRFVLWDRQKNRKIRELN